MTPTSGSASTLFGKFYSYFVMFDICIHLFSDSCVNLLPPPDDLAFLRTAHLIYVKHRKLPEALGLAIRLGDKELIRQDFNAPANP